MKQYIFIIYFLCFYSFVLSQEKDPVHQFFTNNLINNLSKFPLNYQYYNLKNYTASSLYFKTESGSYKDGRTPEAIYDFGLKTQGLYKNKKNILFFGNISIAKNYYKNLKWNLSYELPELGLMEDPHYFGVSKGGNWNNQQYDIQGGCIIPMGTKFNVLTKVLYKLSNLYRVELDPRPEITYNNLNFNMGLSYNLSKNHHLKGSINYGYTHIDNGIDYSNSNKNNPSYYDIYVKWLNGYGSISSPFKNSTQRIMKHKKVNIGYSFSNNQFHLMTDIEYSTNNQITYENKEIIDHKDESKYLAIYKPHKIETNILLIYQTENSKSFKLNINGFSEQGENFWMSKNGKSYSSKHNNLSIDIAYLKLYNNAHFWDIGFATNLWQVNQYDALATTTSNYTNLDLEDYILYSFPLSKTVAFSPYLKNKFRFNVAHKFIQGNKEDFDTIAENDFAAYVQRDFYNEVIIPNAELYSTHQLQLNLGTWLKIATKKEYTISINLEGGINLPLQKMKKFSDSTPNRFNGLLNLTLKY